MSRLFSLLALLAITVLVGLPVLAGPGQPSPVKDCSPALLRAIDYPPPPADDRGYDVLSYDLDLRIDPVTSRIYGTVAIGLASLVQGLEVIQLDLVDNLTCEEVTIATVAASFTHLNDALLVNLPSPLAPGETATVQITWQGRPLRHGVMQVGLLYRLHNAGTPGDPSDDVPIIANISEPWSAHSWWPCKDHPADKALVSLAVTVPDPLRAVSNGTLLAVEEAEPGWSRFSWREEYPLATYLVSVAISDYEMWSEECQTAAGPVTLEYHVFPPDRTKAEYDFSVTGAMMAFMVDVAGPYPFAGEKYAQVEIKWVGAMENTTATSVSQMYLTGDRYHENLIVHELSHHWFGDSLTPLVWADIWLNEGFARYCEALWVEHAYGRQAYLEYMWLIGPRRHPSLFQGESLLGDPDPILPNYVIYDKGAWLVHSLRMYLGDTAFFEFLRSYANDPDLVQGSVGLADMVAAAERVAGKNLAGFFSPWLETDTVPQVWYETEVKASWARVTFHQLQEPVFEMAIPVRVETDCGPVEQMALITKRDQTMTFNLGCPGSAVTVDPDSLVFMFRGEAPPAPVQVRGPWPNPAGQSGTSFDLFVTEETQVFVNIYDVRGYNIQSVDLGLVPPTGPSSDETSLPFVWLLDPETMVPRPASGVYWVEFKANGTRIVRKMALLH